MNVTLTRRHGSHGIQLHRASRDSATYSTRCSCTTIRIKWAYGRNNLLTGERKERKRTDITAKWCKFGQVTREFGDAAMPVWGSEEEELGATHGVGWGWGSPQGWCCPVGVQTTLGFCLQLTIQLSCLCSCLSQEFSKQDSLLWRINPFNEDWKVLHRKGISSRFNFYLDLYFSCFGFKGDFPECLPILTRGSQSQTVPRYSR